MGPFPWAPDVTTTIKPNTQTFVDDGMIQQNTARGMRLTRIRRPPCLIGQHGAFHVVSRAFQYTRQGLVTVNNRVSLTG